MNNYPLLAKSINPKLNFLAVHMNKYLYDTYNYIYDTYDKKTWPYYLNISGEPHLLNTPIYVYSLETSTNVLMNSSFKTQYPATYRLLMEYDKEYNDLVTEYPTQEGYIRGMLNPINIDVAINAEDGDILYYNKDLVEWNEPSLIPNIEKSIKLFLERWLITDYQLVDNLYAPTVYSQIVSLILMSITSYRHTGISRFETTSYYQSQMLESNMGMFIPEGLLDHNSRLWLAKNAQYIATNVGKEFIFNKLITKVLNPSGYSVTEIRASPTKYKPELDKRKILNFKKNNSVLYRAKKIDGDFQHIPVPLSEVLYKVRVLSEMTDIFPIGSISYDKMEKELYENVTYRERSKIYEIHSDKKYRHIDGVSGQIVLESVLNYLATTEDRYFIKSSNSTTTSFSSQEVLTLLLGHLFSLFNLDKSIVLNTIKLDLSLHGDLCSKVPDSHSDIRYESTLLEGLSGKLFDTPAIDITDYTNRRLDVEKSIICELANSNSPYSAAVIEYNYYRGNKPLETSINPLGKSMQTLIDELPINITNDSIDYMKEILYILEQLTGYKDVNYSIRNNLRLVYKFLIRLTSYTITPMLDDDLINVVNDRHEVGAITDTTTVLIDDVTYDCNGAVAIVRPYGDDQINEIKAFDGKDLYVTDNDMSHIPIVVVGEHYNDRIRLSKINITVS